ncbi:MAG: hypothetical protein PHD51_02970 [Patescibacteria group bacterium]|nr:hypothetical protein [Patescibacteria group bacterium]MDD5490183.1 hypothetical protein [Patescibacteria group bacterium]
MRNKILIGVVILVILAIGIGLGFYFGQRGASDKGEALNMDGAPREGVAGDNSILDKADFSIMLPAGWRETSAPPGVSVMAVNAREKITDPEAQKINFQTNFSVSYDTLGDRTREEYVEYFKNTLKQVVPEVVFTGEQVKTINGRDFLLIEATVKQRGVDFGAAVALTAGGSNDIWAISFNATKSNFTSYGELFDKILGSFKIKNK